MKPNMPLALAGACLLSGAAHAAPAGLPEGDPSRNPDMTALARTVDTNGDGKMSRAEWLAQGLPVGSFNMFEQGRGYVTLQDYQTHAAPPGIDLNGDGKLTVAEFKEFDRRGAGRPRPPRS
jgi:hypothetical protein